uniref:Glycerol dehydratase small subunit GldE n=1 Tax=Lentilactobacillus hilgardii TaxID=1588 RepID=Q6YNM2_LENHI|nr:glycerol dehydratase small subunit GldE [Lentilactobacillus hilgardii]
MSEVDELVSKIMNELKDGQSSSTPNSTPESAPSQVPTGKKLGKSDYPLYEKHPKDVKSPTGKSLNEITLENIINGNVTSKDLRITPDTLRMQGQIAASAGRVAIQRNFQRAAGLTAIPDDRVLALYNSLRAYRSFKQELLDTANELRTKYHAPVCAGWFEEAAENYEKDRKLKGDN